ncbi:MAG TPA: LptA/OstA family protein, partial [Opitutaceae bacterium]|nr:LptA/OstA family protein [Opitutaceae bacterium]
MRPLRLLSCCLAVPPLLLILHAAEAPKPPGTANDPKSAPQQDTIITCTGKAELISTPTETTSTFRDNVVVTGTNLRLTCDLLVAVARRGGDPAATIGKTEKFKSLIATGHVHIVQNDREATCGRAEILPGEDKVVLSDAPHVRTLNGDYDATGWKIEMYRGERRVTVLSAPGEQPTLTLPALKDLGFEKQPEKKKTAAP